MLKKKKTYTVRLQLCQDANWVGYPCWCVIALGSSCSPSSLLLTSFLFQFVSLHLVLHSWIRGTSLSHPLLCLPRPKFRLFWRQLEMFTVSSLWSRWLHGSVCTLPVFLSWVHTAGRLVWEIIKPSLYLGSLTFGVPCCIIHRLNQMTYAHRFCVRTQCAATRCDKNANKLVQEMAWSSTFPTKAAWRIALTGAPVFCIFWKESEKRRFSF